MESHLDPHLDPRVDAACFVEAERRLGREVVVASGYFNCLHVGHLRYLEAAAGLGGPLVVIVNSDRQVALKGSVPFMAEA
ncbi:MAG: adenylyltransferase/cytidyltransferase family protein, partial [Gemmataceae bacterium]|nr:adenylyltransferase/cytidyltransferase family protein [Gemmataceae bacterium]